MAVTIKIGGADYFVEADSLSANLALGLAGTSLSFRLTPGQPFPALRSKVEFSQSGLVFVGILTDDGRQSAVTHIGQRSYTATGKQFLLDRNADVTKRISTVGGVLNDLMGATGITGSVIGDDVSIRGYSFKGPIKNALADLAARGSCMLYFTPAGTVELISRETPPAAPGDWIVAAPFGFSNLDKKITDVRPVNSIAVEGGVPKASDTEDDQEEIEVPYKGDGVRTRFSYPKRTDEVFDVVVGEESQTVVPIGDPEQLTADCWNDRSEYEIVFNAAPAEGAEIVLHCRIQKATGRWNDSGAQGQIAGDFGGDGIIEHVESRPEIRTQEEADEYAERLGGVIGEEKKEYTAQVFGYPSQIFHPGRMVRVADNRDGVDETLQVQTNALKYSTDQGGWLQSVTVGNGRDGDTSASGGAFVQVAGGRKSGNQNSVKQLPTETSPASRDFTISISPSTLEVESGDESPKEFLVTVTPKAGFADPVVLSMKGLNCLNAVWNRTTVDPANWTATLSLLPADGQWSNIQGEIGAFTVTGRSFGPDSPNRTHSVNGSITMDGTAERMNFTVSDVEFVKVGDEYFYTNGAYGPIYAQDGRFDFNVSFSPTAGWNKPLIVVIEQSHVLGNYRTILSIPPEGGVFAVSSKVGRVVGQHEPANPIYLYRWLFSLSVFGNRSVSMSFNEFTNSANPTVVISNSEPPYDSPDGYLTEAACPPRQFILSLTPQWVEVEEGTQNAAEFTVESEAQGAFVGNIRLLGQFVVPNTELEIEFADESITENGSTTVQVRFTSGSAATWLLNSVTTIRVLGIAAGRENETLGYVQAVEAEGGGGGG